MPRVDLSPREEVVPEKIQEDDAGEFKTRQRRRSSLSAPLIDAAARRGSALSVESCATSRYRAPGGDASSTGYRRVDGGGAPTVGKPWLSGVKSHLEKSSSRTNTHASPQIARDMSFHE